MNSGYVNVNTTPYILCVFSPEFNYCFLDNGSLLLWINVNPSMDKQRHAQKSKGWNYFAIPKLQLRWCLKLHKQFHLILYDGYNYLSRVVLMLKQVSEVVAVDSRICWSILPEATTVVSDPTTMGTFYSYLYWISVHYNDVIMGAMASQITSLTIVYSTVYSGADHRGPVNSPHKWPVTRKMFPFDDVSMNLSDWFRVNHCPF